MQTLKHIVVDIDLIDYYERADPLAGIVSMLEDMRTKNVIETVTIGILRNIDANRRLKDDWGRLDEVLTSTGWFSLKRVTLTIDVVHFEGSEDELKVALHKLWTHFFRLSSSNSVSFDIRPIHKFKSR